MVAYPRYQPVPYVMLNETRPSTVTLDISGAHPGGLGWWWWWGAYVCSVLRSVVVWGEVGGWVSGGESSNPKGGRGGAAQANAAAGR